MILVGLPAYNEGRRINSLINDIHKSLMQGNEEYKIIVYDDGSSDDTAARVLSLTDSEINIHLIKGEKNKGLGHALSNLIEYCVEMSSPDDIILIMDADATHNPQHIHRMLSYIRDGFDVVIASRYTPYSRIRGVSLKRRFLSNTANFIFRVMFPMKGVCDYSCSYRAYTAKILKLAKDIYKDRLIEEHGFACMAEFLIKLRRLAIIACEVPLILRYDRKAGGTKMHIVSNIDKTFRLIMRSFFLPGFSHKTLTQLRNKYKA